MPVNFHIHPNLEKLPKFSFQRSTKKPESLVQPMDKHGIDGKETEQSDQNNTEEKQVEEERNEALRTAIKFGVAILVIGVTIPAATWLFKKTAGMIREAKEVGKAITG